MGVMWIPLAVWIGSFIYIIVRLVMAAWKKRNERQADSIGWIGYIPLPIRWVLLLGTLLLFAPIVAAMDAMEGLRPRTQTTRGT